MQSFGDSISLGRANSGPPTALGHVSFGAPPLLARSVTYTSPKKPRPKDRRAFRTSLARARFNYVTADSASIPQYVSFSQLDAPDITSIAPALAKCGLASLLREARDTIEHAELPKTNLCGWQGFSPNEKTAISHTNVDVDPFANESAVVDPLTNESSVPSLRACGLQGAVKLSSEQAHAVSCSGSMFLQGRSGTGKTLVLIRRILEKAQHVASQLYVTKSSLLRDEVSAALSNASCKISLRNWPPVGVLCATWQDVVQLIRPGTQLANINYDMFLGSYWPQLRPCARQLPPLLVWTEFSTRLRPFGAPTYLRVCGSATKSLDLEAYMRSNVAALGLCLEDADQRAIYHMFIEYTRMKAIRKQSDDVDIAQSLLGVQTSLCEALYIDEAQDFAPAELIAILRLCKNINGVTVVGDTCQTINPGSAFSFQEIANEFYRNRSAEVTSLQVKDSLMTLRCNYRSTSSITGLASTLTQLLLQRFPYCMDFIDEETSFTDTCPIPIFLQMPGQIPGDCIMGRGHKRMSLAEASGLIVLVPSHAMRNELRNQQVSGTILTVAEAKGLEFDVVVLCGFFTHLPDATVDGLADSDSKESQLAKLVVDSQSSLYGQLDAGDRLSTAAHARLCRVVLAIPELKSLYVAITRAKKGCVLLECGREPQQWASFLRLWQKMGVVQLCEERDYARMVGEAEPTERIDHYGSKARVIQWIKAEQLKVKEKGKALKALREELKRLEAGGEVDTNFGASYLNKYRKDPKMEIVTSSNEDMLAWIQSELALCKGHAYKQEKRVLLNGLKCLQEGGKLDPNFRQEYDDLVLRRRSQHKSGLASKQFEKRVEQQSSVSTVEPPQVPMFDFAELRSFWPAVERRFGEGSTSVTSMTSAAQEIRTRALKLFSHALDDQRERWRLFGEARQGLREALAVADAALLNLFDLRFAGISQTMVTVTKLVFQAPSWRGTSTLRCLSKIRPWEHIWSFLVPPGTDIHESVRTLINCAAEHARFQAEVKREIVLATAWYYLSGARRNTKALELEGQSREEALAVLQKADDTDTWGQKIKESMHALWRSAREHADKCAEAARAFMAAGQPKLAAGMFEEATDVFLLLSQTTKHWHPVKMQPVVNLYGELRYSRTSRGQCFLHWRALSKKQVLPDFSRKVVFGGWQNALRCLSRSCFQRWRAWSAMREMREAMLLRIRHQSLSAALCWCFLGCATGWGNAWASEHMIIKAFVVSLVRAGVVSASLECVAKPGNVEVFGLALLSAKFLCQLPALRSASSKLHCKTI